MKVEKIIKEGFPINFRERSRDNPDKWILVDANTSDEALSIWLRDNPNNHYVGMITEKVSEENLSARIEKSNKLWNSFPLL